MILIQNLINDSLSIKYKKDLIQQNRLQSINHIFNMNLRSCIYGDLITNRSFVITHFDKRTG